MKPALIALLTLAVLSQGCFNHTKYRLQLEGNPDAAAGRACVSACRRSHGEEPFDCYARCPGVTVTKGAWCETDDRPPVATCATKKVASVDGFALLAFAALLILPLLYVHATEPKPGGS